MISTRNLAELPEPEALKKLASALAMLDAIIEREWEYRYYSYNGKVLGIMHRKLNAQNSPGLPGYDSAFPKNILRKRSSPLRRFLVPILFAFASVSSSSAQSVPSAIYTDPPTDKDHPAGMTVLHIPTHGFLINGLLYSPPGSGPHPTLVICHGLPGNEKNLDLAQAVRRAGWNAITFNYRGSWGSPGQFRFTQNLEDTDAVLAYLRTPEVAIKLAVDTKRIAIAGHSMGGWAAAHTASHDPALIGLILISMGRMGGAGEIPRQKLVELMAGNMETLAGVTAESMADEVLAHAQEFRLDSERVVAGLRQIPLLALTSDDGLAPHTEALVRAIESQGGKKVKSIHAATDHGWSDKRIFLESTIISWLSELR